MRSLYALFFLAIAGVCVSQNTTMPSPGSPSPTMTSPGSPAPTMPPSTNNTKPSIVLVHGPLADGSSWSNVIPLLRARNYKNVWAVQQPLSSVPNDIAKVNDALQWIPGPVVLVGHSLGGLVITNAGNHPNVKALVYIAALAPDQNQTVFDIAKNYTNYMNYTAPPMGSVFNYDQQGRFYMNQTDFVKYVAPDVPLPAAWAMAAAQGLTDSGRFNWTSGEPAWRNKTSYMLVAGRDKIIPQQILKWQASNINANRTVMVPGASHAVLVSRAVPVADLILKAARDVARNNNT